MNEASGGIENCDDALEFLILKESRGVAIAFGVISGYNSVSARISGAGAANTTATNGFNVTGGRAAAANLVYGAITIANHTGNTWVESGVLSATGTAYVLPSGGSIALAAALTQVRITTANGTDTFDAGSINIQYE